MKLYFVYITSTYDRLVEAKELLINIEKHYSSVGNKDDFSIHSIPEKDGLHCCVYPPSKYFSPRPLVLYKCRAN